MRRSALLLFTLLCVPIGASAQDAADFTHAWKGAIKIPGSPLEVLVELKVDAAGTWSGTIDIPAQGADDLPLDEVAIDGAEATFRIQGVPGKPTFKGKLTDDKKTLSGTFTQAGAKFPFELTRKDIIEASESKKLGASLEGFDEVVMQMLEEWETPGVSVALISGNEVVRCKGYGLRDVAMKKPVTENTLFAIGSSSKAFTTALIGTLVDEGKASWDGKLRSYRPTIAFSDPVATAELTLRDAVTHRSGLPRHDFVWYGRDDLTVDTLFAALPHLEFSQPIRAEWQYNNLMYAAAGHIAGELAGSDWGTAITKRIFEPLGMTRANTSIPVTLADADAATPYENVDGKNEAVPWRRIEAVGPAGAINASATDMSKWVLFHLSQGKSSKSTILSTEQFAEMHRPQMVMSAPPGKPEGVDIQMPSYALGWMVEMYRGRRHIHHGGNIDGFSALVSFFPDEGAGVVVLVNKGGSPLTAMIAREAADRLLGLEKIDWLALGKTQRSMAKKTAAAAKEKKDETRVSGTSLSHPLEDYAGEYEHPAYGRITVQASADGLSATCNTIEANVEHWHYDTVRLVPKQKALEDISIKATFHAAADGTIDGIEAHPEPLVGVVTFKKRPPSRLFDPTFLEKLTGEYAFDGTGGGRATIALSRGNVLTLTVPGQPTYILVPRRDVVFAIEKVEGYTAHFTLGEDGRASTLTMHQPNGIFSAKRKPAEERSSDSN